MKIFGIIASVLCMVIAIVFLHQGHKEDVIIMLLMSIFFKLQSSED